MLITKNKWKQFFEGESADALMKSLPAVLQRKRWFGGKSRQIKATRIAERIPLSCNEIEAMFLLVLVVYVDETTETYQLPVLAAFGDDAAHIQSSSPESVLGTIEIQEGIPQSGILYDAAWNREFSLSLLRAIGQGTRATGTAGALTASSTNAYKELVRDGTTMNPTVLKGEQSNTSIAFSAHVILKLYRRLEEGMNPDLEIGRVLTSKRFPYVPPIAGALEYRRTSGEPITLALLQQFVRNDGDAWRHSLDAVDRYMLRVVGAPYGDEQPPQTVLSLLDLARDEYHPAARELIGLYLESAERLGQRTAELHLALSQVENDPAFAPEPLLETYRKSRYDRMTLSASDTFALLRQRASSLSTTGQAKAQRVFDLKAVLDRIYGAFRNLEAPVSRIRCHGDYHLGQVLCTGPDFMIIDFEGEPARSLAERRMKHPAVVDVAGMVRSFHYAPFAFLEGKRTGIAVASNEIPQHAALWAQFWSMWVSAAFLKAYLGIANGTRFWPQDETVVRLLFNVYLLEKAVYELGYELNNRPDWVEIPLDGLKNLLETME